MSTDTPPDEQRHLEEFVEDTDPDRCQAYSVTESRQCRHDALAGVPYCPQHYHLYSGE
jgi:hypothetical protein